MKDPVEEAMRVLRGAIEKASRDQIKHELRAVLGNETVVLNAVIRGNLVVPPKPFNPEETSRWLGDSLDALRAGTPPVFAGNKLENNRIGNSRKPRSAASLAKQAAAMRKVWRAKRRAQKGKK